MYSQFMMHGQKNIKLRDFTSTAVTFPVTAYSRHIVKL